MKILSPHDLNAISGGVITVTQKISLDGLSEPCIQTLTDITNANDHDYLFVIGTIKLIQHCSIQDLCLLEDRTGSAPILTAN